MVERSRYGIGCGKPVLRRRIQRYRILSIAVEHILIAQYRKQLIIAIHPQGHELGIGNNTVSNSLHSLCMALHGP